MALQDIGPVLNQLGQTVDLLQKDMGIPYFDALIETGDNLLSGDVHVEDDHPSAENKAKLEELYDKINLDGLKKDDIRLLLQLLILQGYKKEIVQANHQMTPDTIGFLVADILGKIFKGQKEIKLLDMGVGTGNLLFSVINQLPNKVQAYGIDNDDTLLTLASLSSQLQNTDVDLFHQDGLDPLLIPEVDAAISDLPVGYYPIDSKAEQFKTHRQEGHSYAHFLLLEQAMRQTKASGIGVFIVPSNIFQSKDGMPLLKYIQEVGYLQAFLNLPQGMFKNEQSRKSIILVQKKGKNAHQADQVLLGDYPEFKNKKEFAAFLAQIDDFIKNNISLDK